jgi:hypothetical protein
MEFTKKFSKALFTRLIATLQVTYASYRALVTALKAASAKPRMSAKLAALKPGRAQIMTAVSAAHLSPQESRLAQIESVLVALGNASTVKKRPF